MTRTPDDGLSTFVGPLQEEAARALAAPLLAWLGEPAPTIVFERSVSPKTAGATRAVVRLGDAALGILLRAGSEPSAWSAGPLSFTIERDIEGRAPTDRAASVRWLRRLAGFFGETPPEERERQGAELAKLHHRWATLHAISDRDYRHVEHAHSGRTAFMRPTFRCNQDCHFCWEGRDWPDPPEELVWRWLEELGATGARMMTFCGGEPTLSRQLPELVERARTYGMSVHLHSNAIKLRNLDYATRLREAGVSSVLVSFHSADPDVSDAMTRAPGTWRRTVEGVHGALDAGMRVVLNCCVERANVEGLAAHAAFIVEHFVRAHPDNPVRMVNYSQPGRYYDGAVFTEQLVAIDVARPHLTAAARILHEAGVLLEITGTCGFPACVATEITDLVPWRAEATLDSTHASSRVHDPAPCHRCAARAHCIGVRREYLAQWGERGLVPFEALPTSDWYERVAAAGLGDHWAAEPEPARIPSPAEAEDRLQQLLARGSRNLGGAVGIERLMLMLTRSCELRCGYCHVAKTETGPEMSTAVAYRAVDLLMRSERPRLELQMFGGEPLRRWPVIAEVLAYASKHPGRDGRQLEFILTTNGIKLEEDVVRRLEEYPVVVLFSCDGKAENHQRFRSGHLLDDPEAYAAIQRGLERLQGSSLRWFMHTVFPPAASGDVVERYRWARAQGIPRLQLAYAIGARWSEAHRMRYLEGLAEVLRDHRARPEGLELFNWQNGCEPLILSDDLTVDVDGTLLHDGAIFLERGFPRLREVYRRGHLDSLTAFDPLRWSFAQLHGRLLEAYGEGTPERETLLDNARFGARVDLLIDRLRAESGRAV